jgi:Flp pilus assembly protein TadG
MANPARRFPPAEAKRSLARDSRGATLVEFGLFFPIVALLLLGTIDIGLGLATRFRLEQATQRTIELATIVGRPQTDYSYLVPEAVRASGVPAAQVTLGQWLECRTSSGATRRETNFNGGCATGEQAARYVTITIWQNYVPMFASIPLLGRVGSGPNGSIRLTADSGVRVQ